MFLLPLDKSQWIKNIIGFFFKKNNFIEYTKFAVLDAN